MNNPEHDRIIQENKQKYILSGSTQLFHSGVIILTSLIIGLIYFQFEPMPADVKPEDVSLLQQGFGLWLGAIIAVCGLFCYLIWALWRGYKFQKAVRTEIQADALKKLEKK